MENIKRILSSLLFSLFICCFLFSCNEKKTQVPDEKDSQELETVIRPDQIITVDIARKQYDTYGKRRVKLIQDYEDAVDGYDKIGKGKKDPIANANPNDPNGKRFDVARYVSWDYETIKNYLKYIENEAANANIEIKTLRFYFSNYPADDKSAVHPRQNSIMITPTLEMNNQEYIFAIDDSDIKNLRPQLLNNEFVPIPSHGKGSGYKSNIQDDKAYASFFPNITTTPNNISTSAFFAVRSVTMNRGGSAPPPY